MNNTRNGMRITGLLITMVMLLALLGAFCLTVSAAESVSYVDREWNGTEVVSSTKTVSDYTSMTSETTTLTSGWYVVDSNVTYDTRLTVTGAVHLILTDGVTLTANEGISVNKGNELYVYGQSNDESKMGKLLSFVTREPVGDVSDAAIGGDLQNHAGKIVFNGGYIKAHTTNQGAAVGSGMLCAGYDIIINGGVIFASSEVSGASIGSGNSFGNGELDDIRSIRIHGGTVTTEVSNASGAAIGGGNGFNGGNITITGGFITASTRGTGAAIGGGRDADGGNITISGGTVIAKNESSSQGAAGIGGGYNSSGGNIVITGGDITAAGGWGAAGIGGYSNAGNILITGGKINSTGNVRACGIGGGVSGISGCITILASDVTIQQAASGCGNVGFGEDANRTGSAMVLSGDTITVSGNYTLGMDYTIPTGYTLVISDGATLSILEDVTFVNNGNFEIIGNGKINCPLPHKGDSTCKTATQCTVCGTIYLNADNHEQPNEFVYTLNPSDVTKHDKKYACCGLVIETLEHTFDSTGFCENGCYEPAVLNADGYYEISNAGQLYWFARLVNIEGITDANAILTADIDLENRVWYPIGLYNDIAEDGGEIVQKQYAGTFNGNNHTISNFTAIGNGSQGLIGYSNTVAVAKNLCVYNATVSGWNAGAILAFQGKVENCYVMHCDITACTSSTDAGTVYAGAVAGSQAPTVTNCFAYNCIVSAGEGFETNSTIAPVGGKSGKITNSYYYGITSINGTLRQENGETEAKHSRIISGEIAHLLQGDQTEEIWGQNITTDDYPTLGAEPVPSENFIIYGQKLNLGGYLSMKFYVSGYTQEFDPAKLDLEILFLGKVSHPTYTEDEDGFYVFTLKNINPQCMGDSIYAKLSYDGKEFDSVGYEEKYSVEIYLNNLLTMLGAYSDVDHIITLINDTLAYGTAASQYKDYSSLENEYTGSDREIPFSEAQLSDVIPGYTVKFGTANGIIIKVDPNAFANNIYRVYCNGDAIGNYKKPNSNQYAIYNISATDFDKKYEFIVKDNIPSGPVYGSIAISINDYLYSISQSATSTAEMKALAKALYNYGVSAKLYDHITNSTEEHVFISYTDKGNGMHEAECGCGEIITEFHNTDTKDESCHCKATIIKVSNEEELKSAISKDGVIVLTDDITLSTDSDGYGLQVSTKTIIDLNGHILSSEGTTIYIKDTLGTPTDSTCRADCQLYDSLSGLILLDSKNCGIIRGNVAIKTDGVLNIASPIDLEGDEYELHINKAIYVSSDLSQKSWMIHMDEYGCFLHTEAGGTTFSSYPYNENYSLSTDRTRYEKVN